MKRILSRQVSLHIITAFLLFSLWSGITFASREYRDYFDELAYVDLQLSAISIDMSKYLAWFFDDKETMKKVSQENIDDLDKIRAYIENLDMPKELAEIKDMNLRVIDIFKNIYKGIEHKDLDAIRQEFEGFGRNYSSFSDKFEEYVSKYTEVEDMPENFDPFGKELEVVESKTDRHFYATAVDLIEAKEYQQAYRYLNAIKNKYENTAFGDCVMLRISDCILIGNSDLPGYDPEKAYKDTLKMLSDIVDRARYSPVLFEAFYKWRTMEQHCTHGDAKNSEIPNKIYNEKRWKLTKVAKRHLDDNPDDIWAKSQIDLLLNLPNITRSSSLGNDNLEHLIFLYTDLQPE